MRDPIVPAEAPVPAKAADPSPALSILAKTVPTLLGRKVGCLVSDGVDGEFVAELQAAVLAAGAKFQVVAPTIYGVVTAAGDVLPADHEVKGGPSVFFDAVAIVPSIEGGAKLALQSEAVNFLRDAYGPRFLPRPLLKTLVRAGYTGRKSGRGWYRYKDGKRV